MEVMDNLWNSRVYDDNDDYDDWWVFGVYQYPKANQGNKIGGEFENLGMTRVWWRTTLAITVSILSLFPNIADAFDGGGSQPKQQPTLCDELILPAGYPCSEYVVLTLTLSQPLFNSMPSSYVNWTILFVNFAF